MLSSIYEHAAYAEDQQHAKSILGLHVTLRGLQVGAALGAATGAVRAILLRRNSILTPPLARVLINSIGVGSSIGGAFFTLLTPLRMRGKEEIEWQDRSWRLLANKHQEQVDNWTTTGELLGMTAIITRDARRGAHLKALQGAIRVIGGAGAGNLTALGALMLWRVVVRGDP